MKTDYEDELSSAEKCYFKGGNILKNLLSNREKLLSGSDCMELRHTYGLSPKFIKLLAMSHGCDIDEQQFIILLHKFDQKIKTVKAKHHEK